jgi:hypothetical protein
MKQHNCDKVVERPIIMSSESVRAILDGRKTQTRRVVKPIPETYPYEITEADCTYGKVGDRLWVKEKYGFKPSVETGEYETVYCDDFYIADELIWTEYGLWKNPMFMPRSYSRLTLEITDVRCERLQDISKEDCFNEGIIQIGYKHFHNGIQSGELDEDDNCYYYSTPEESYSRLWNTLYTKRGFPWESNPYVWAIEFKRVEEENK